MNFHPMAPSQPTSDRPGRPQPRNQHQLVLDSRLLSAFLLLAIIAMLAIWRPWAGAGAAGASAADRTIHVTGQAVVKAEPDQYTFSPAYQFTSNDRNALSALAKKNDSLLTGLKQAGVASNQIKTNANDYRPGGIYYTGPASTPDVPAKGIATSSTYILQLVVSVQSKATAQKVQDFLVTTSPMGALTPNVSFSDAQRKQLEDQARDLATRDARGKAEQSAKNLGFKLGGVKSVSDGSGFGGSPVPLAGGAAVAPGANAESVAPAIPLQPGENELNYSISVEYYVR